MHRHLTGLAIAGLTAAAMLGVAGTGSAQDKGGYQGVPRTFLWANGPIEFTDTAQYKKDPPYVIGFSNASVSNIWRVGMQHAIEAAAARHADQIDKLIITDANDDPAKQAADIQDLVEREVDLLIVSPATAEALDPAVTRAMSRGIPVVLVDRRVTSDNFVSFVTATDWALARFMAQWLAETLNFEGNIVMLPGLAGASPAENRIKAAHEVFDKYPGIKILELQYTDWSPAKGKQVMSALIQKYGDQIDGVWSDHGLQGSGAIEAFVAAGYGKGEITAEHLRRPECLREARGRVRRAGHQLRLSAGHGRRLGRSGAPGAGRQPGAEDLRGERRRDRVQGTRDDFDQGGQVGRGLCPDGQARRADPLDRPWPGLRSIDLQGRLSAVSRCGPGAMARLPPRPALRPRFAG